MGQTIVTEISVNQRCENTRVYIYYLILKIYFLYYSFCYHTFCDSFIHSNLEIFLHLSLFIVVINKQTQLLYNYIKIQQHVFAYNFDNNLTIFFTKT